VGRHEIIGVVSIDKIFVSGGVEMSGKKKRLPLLDHLEDTFRRIIAELNLIRREIIR
jgi:hypothetical protein